MESAFVTFTREELWLLHTFVRHEMQGMELWHLPPADLGLNEDIAFALSSCYHLGLDSFVLELNHQQLLVIDYHIRRDYKGPPAQNQALGQDILLKTFSARNELAGLRSLGEDKTYKEVLNANASADDCPNDNPNDDSGAIPAV